jgi:hypothetical protein
MNRREVVQGVAVAPLVVATPANAAYEITVVITTWQVPFDQVVRAIKTFTNEAEALEFINGESKKWWDGVNGDTNQTGYEPIKELGYDGAHYALWGGECGFHAMLDHASYARLHEAHYKRNYDDQGCQRPGYLQVAYLQGNKPE